MVGSGRCGETQRQTAWNLGSILIVRPFERSHDPSAKIDLKTQSAERPEAERH
jgi:hypothetical protein